MRNYWLRIALGALAIFGFGMMARALINRGIGGVRSVVEGSGPLSIPLAFIPFTLGGAKLGSLERVTLLRDAPRRVTSVELEVELSDSLLARGLEGCRLAAHFDHDREPHRGVNVSGIPFADGFWCAATDSTSEGLVEYGHAVFHPGDVTVPLFLSQDLVDELQDLDLDADSAPPIDEAQTDSIVAAAEMSRDSVQARRGWVDSIRREGRRHADSVRREMIQMADSTGPR